MNPVTSVNRVVHSGLSSENFYEIRVCSEIGRYFRAGKLKTGYVINQETLYMNILE